jgi:hypothetical protein
MVSWQHNTTVIIITVNIPSQILASAKLLQGLDLRCSITDEEQQLKSFRRQKSR